MRLFAFLYCLAVAVFSTHLKPQNSKAECIAAGKEIYRDFCVQCHLFNGEGVSGVFPPLKASDYLFENINRSIAGIKYGLKGEISWNTDRNEKIQIISSIHLDLSSRFKRLFEVEGLR